MGLEKGVMVEEWKLNGSRKGQNRMDFPRFDALGECGIAISGLVDLRCFMPGED